MDAKRLGALVLTFLLGAGAATAIIYTSDHARSWINIHPRSWNAVTISKSIERGDGIVAAIDRFIAARGKPPQTLEEQVPEFLKVIPSPAVDNPRWEFSHHRGNYTLSFSADSKGYPYWYYNSDSLSWYSGE